MYIVIQIIMSEGYGSKAPGKQAGLICCAWLLKYRAVASQEQVAALAGIITYVTFQV